jgi:DNA-binding response OmpR family regulator
MPGLSGWNVASECRAHFPHCRVGLVTGWGDQLDTELVASSGVAFVLAKLFDATEVVRLVATVLRAPINVRRLNATVTRTGTGALN